MTCKLTVLVVFLVLKNSAAKNAPRIMVAAHMDEVGFMVSDIKADGTIRAVGIGGWNPLVLSSQRFTLYTRDGRAIPVVSGSVPPHFLRGANGSAALPKIDDIIFDAGFTDKAEAESFGILPATSSYQNLKQFSQPTKKMLSLKLGTIASVCLW